VTPHGRDRDGDYRDQQREEDRAPPSQAACNAAPLLRRCFDPADAPAERTTQGFAWLETLWSTIAERAATRPEGSYTAGLLAGGVGAVARKVTEEATEVLLAAKDDAAAGASGADRAATGEALAAETADLLYHALVLLAERGVAPAAVIGALEARRRR